MNNNEDNILITGAAGFIGAELSKKFLRLLGDKRWKVDLDLK